MNPGPLERAPERTIFKTMKPIALILPLALLAAGCTAPQDDGRAQLETAVAQEIGFYAPDVDVQRLTTHQLAAINSVLGSPRPTSEKRLLIKSILREGLLLR